MIRLQSENGLLYVPMLKSALKGIKNTGYLWSRSIVSYIEQGMAIESGNGINHLLNLLLHRTASASKIKLRTMTDLVRRHGEQYIDEQVSWGNRVLEENGWNPESALPYEETITDFHTHEDAPTWLSCGNNLTDEQERAAVDDLIKDINSRRLPEAQIPAGSIKPYQVEPDDSLTIKVSLDGVNAKRQKDKRPKGVHEEESCFIQDINDGPADYGRAPDPKKRPKVETSVAVIEVDQQKYVFAARNMFEACKLVLAFLLYHKLLVNRNVVFFVDGGKDIRKCINDLFAFCTHQVVLDWFHLKKHCLEWLSMSLNGGKQNREMQYTVRRQLFHILWAGNVEGAIAYLESLDSSKIKNRQRLDELISYLRNKDPEIACYAVRRSLGLRISSNRVEKANDLIVAERQKGKGMSWSRQGSWSLANITTMYLNHEADLWHREGTISYEMYDSYGQLFVPQAS